MRLHTCLLADSMWWWWHKCRMRAERRCPFLYSIQFSAFLVTTFCIFWFNRSISAHRPSLCHWQQVCATPVLFT
ncbi:hypothetical protein B0H10DRAFT_2080366 [Mycena sp. CBHHK59/15]|nr:hypothetical protein B0H10DRAFT_2080366 [Mycena sp. CBHHK59/15]